MSKNDDNIHPYDRLLKVAWGDYAFMSERFKKEFMMANPDAKLDFENQELPAGSFITIRYPKNV